MGQKKVNVFEKTENIGRHCLDFGAFSVRRRYAEGLKTGIADGLIYSQSRRYRSDNYVLTVCFQDEPSIYWDRKFAEDATERECIHNAARRIRHGDLGLALPVNIGYR